MVFAFDISFSLSLCISLSHWALSIEPMRSMLTFQNALFHFCRENPQSAQLECTTLDNKLLIDDSMYKTRAEKTHTHKAYYTKTRNQFSMRAKVRILPEAFC